MSRIIELSRFLVYLSIAVDFYHALFDDIGMLFKCFSGMSFEDNPALAAR